MGYRDILVASFPYACRHVSAIMRPSSKVHVCVVKAVLLCSTLLTIVGNLVDRPEEPKFRRIRKAATAFHQSLGRLPGGCEALLAVGFTSFAEPNGDQVLTDLSPVVSRT